MRVFGEALAFHDAEPDKVSTRRGVGERTRPSSHSQWGLLERLPVDAIAESPPIAPTRAVPKSWPRWVAVTNPNPNSARANSPAMRTQLG